MDIHLQSESASFTLRAAALIVQDGRALLVRNDLLDCFYTVGGKVRLNETSTQAVLRECQEETGCRLEVDRLVFVQERFLRAQDVRHHEVVFFYLMKPAKLAPTEGACMDQPGERLHWVPFAQLAQLRLLPAFLAGALPCLPGEVTHIGSHD